MRENNTLKKKEMYPLLAAMLLAATAYAIADFLAGVFPGGERIFMTGDLYIQYAPLNRLFWKGLLEGRPLSYSFSLGPGMPGIAVYAYYCLSPFHILFAFIEDADLASFIIALIKISLASGCFYIFAHRCLKADRTMAVVCSVFYALCGYTAAFSFYLTFMDAVYMLPVIVLCIRRAFEKDSYAPLCLAYLYSFVVFFYSGYMLGIFTALLFVAAALFTRKGKSLLAVWVKYFLCVLTAALMSAVVLLPAAVYLFSNMADDIKTFRSLSVTVSGVIANLFIGQFQGYAGHLPLIYSGCFIIVLIPVLFFGKKEYMTEKKMAVVSLVFLLLCTFLPVAYLFVHAFDMPDNFDYRFTYMFSFVFLSLCCIAEKEAEGKGKAVCISAAAGAALYGLVYLYTVTSGKNAEMSISGLIVNTFFLACWAFMFTVMKKKKIRSALMCALAAIEAAVNLYMVQTPDDNGLLRQNSYYRLWTTQAGLSISELKQRDKGFWRLYYENFLFADDPAYYSYNGLGYFLSIEQPALRKALGDMGYAVSSRVVCDYGGTPLGRMLFSQKYMIHGTDPRYESNDSFGMAVNDFALPLGFMVSSDILDHEPGSDPFDNQNRLFGVMCGSGEKKVFDIYEGEPGIITDGTELTEKGEGYSLKKTGDVSRTVFRIPHRDGVQAYAYFIPEIKGLWTDSALLVSESADTGMIAYDSMLSFSHILPMGQDESGMDEAAVYMTGNTVSGQGIEKTCFAYFDTEVFMDIYNTLSAGGMEIKSFKDDEISGSVHAGKDSVLFTSIPYDQDWHVEADGVEKETIGLMDGAFLGVFLDEGEHILHIYYKNRWIKPGMIMSLTGIFLFIGMIFLDFDMNHKKQVMSKLADND